MLKLFTEFPKLITIFFLNHSIYYIIFLIIQKTIYINVANIALFVSGMSFMMLLSEAINVVV